MYQGPERRQYKRIRKKYIMRFSIKSHGTDTEQSDWDMVALVDVGAGGALFYYNQNIDAGASLDLKVNFDPNKDPIHCTGKVIRCVELQYSYMYLIAVNFEDLPEADKNTIDASAEEFYAQRPRYLED